MTLTRLSTGLVLFLTLSGGSLANLLLMQPKAGHAVQPMSRPVAVTDASRANSARPSVATQSPETRQGVLRELASRGYLASDGEPTANAFAAAIMAFEADHGLALTGEPSDGLLQSLILGAGGGAAATSAPGTATARRLTAEVADALASLGVMRGQQADLPAAIRAFEREAKLPETGAISAPLIEALTRAGQRRKVALKLRP